MVVVSSRAHDLVKMVSQPREFLAAHPTFPALSPHAWFSVAAFGKESPHLITIVQASRLSWGLMDESKT